MDDFLQMAALLHPDTATAESYARAAVALEAYGQFIPENDCLDRGRRPRM